MYNEHMELSLARALRIADDSCIAFIGAGGKTQAIFNLAREIKTPVVITATSHLGDWQTTLADRHIITNESSIKELENDFQGILLVTGESDGSRTQPINPALLNWLCAFCKSKKIPLLIEADGSREKPLKAWAEHEPPIPEFVNLIVHVAGLKGLGMPLDDKNIHHPEIFSKLSGLKHGETITRDALITVITHSDGGLKNIPKNARTVVLLNQADTPETQSMAYAMATPLLSTHHSVIVASLLNNKIHAVHEPIAGIILAAGASSRFGEPKQVLDWKGETFVKAVAKTALNSGLSPVIVVTGANAEQVESAVADINVGVVRNTNWNSGQGSSIKAGLDILPPECGGVIFLLADQPQVDTSIIQALKEKHAEGLHPIVAPMVLDRRANPVLFDRVTFPDLMEIEGDTGGRAIFHKHRVEYLPWHDDSLLLDVDTPENYQRLISSGDI